jgi:hypothetical protein
MKEDRRQRYLERTVASIADVLDYIRYEGTDSMANLQEELQTLMWKVSKEGDSRPLDRFRRNRPEEGNDHGASQTHAEE